MEKSPSSVADCRSVKKFPLFTEPEGSLSCSEEPAARPYLEPVESSLHFTPCFFKISFNIILLSSDLLLGLLNGRLPSDFPTQILCELLVYSMHITCAAHLIHHP
jgi:hypothetical protein